MDSISILLVVYYQVVYYFDILLDSDQNFLKYNSIATLARN